jgi:carbonic anhydrase
VTNWFKQYQTHNTQFIAKLTALDSDYFKKLSHGQSPDILFVTCIDSRIDPFKLINASLGDALVHRNIANLVQPQDMSVAATITFAINKLNVSHIVVMGHTHCGGIQCALNPPDSFDPTVKNWINPVITLASQFRPLLDTVSSNVQSDCLSVLNIQDQARHVSQQLPSHSNVTVHGWLFEISSGSIKDVSLTTRPLKDRFHEALTLVG